MEKIINYKLNEFLKLNDELLIQEYSAILEHLRPLKELSNPRARWYNKKPKKLQVKAIRELSFGDVTLARTLYNEQQNEGVFQIIKMITGLEEKEVLGLTILEFYGIISYIKQELTEINNLELNELQDDSFDFNLEAVNANKRMSRFGVLNIINVLAKEDVLRWSEIEKLPYLTVFTKLLMVKEKNNIQRELAELQKKKQ
jgi:hypothetical protein